MKLSLSLIVFCSILTISCQHSNAQKDLINKYSTYYPLLSQVLEGKFVQDYGVEVITKGLMSKELDADEVTKKVYFVIDTAFTYSSNGEVEYLQLITHTNTFDANGSSTNDCHACATTIGNFIFTKSDDGNWIFTSGNEDLTKAGSFGSENYTISVHKMNEYDVLLIVGSTYSGMGQTTETSELFINSSLIMRVPTYESGDVPTNNGRVEYENKTVISTAANSNIITLKRKGTGINDDYKKIKVDKTTSFDYTKLLYNTIDF